MTSIPTRKIEMITPKEAEELATKHVQEFVNACKPNDLEDVGNALLKLLSTTGQAMIATQGQDVALAMGEWYLRGDENEALNADAERQEAKIKALRESLQWALSNISEEPYEWSCEEDSDAHTAAIALSKEAT